jgi:hypothetical protein
MAACAEFSHHGFSERVQRKVKDELNEFGHQVKKAWPHGDFHRQD